jgi:cell wall assembly regulator SMI1
VLSLVELEDVFANAVGHRPFAPGLDDGRIDELLSASGLTLPAEVRAYFRAHDGVRPPSRVQAPWLIGHWLPLPLEEALRERDVRRDMALEEFQAEPDEADGVWGSGWLPLFRAGNGYILAVDCAAPTGPEGQAPLLRMARVTPAPLELDSLAALFGFFTLALTTGTWSWDDDRKRWLFDRDRLAGNPLVHAL